MQSEEAVNQIPKLLLYREHASRFAHQLDAAHGFNSTQTAAEEDSLITHQTLSAMLGTAWKRYGDWEKVDPEELIVGGNYDGTLLWKRFESDYDQTDFDICGQCNISTFARRFRKKANLIEFRRVYRQGIIYSADRTTTPWSPHAFDIIASPSPYGEVYAALEKQYQLALDYYDDVVGPVDHA